MAQPHWSGKLWPGALLATITFFGTIGFKPRNPKVEFRPIPWSCIGDDNYFSWQTTDQAVIGLAVIIFIVSFGILLVSYLRILWAIRKRRQVVPIVSFEKNTGETAGNIVDEAKVIKLFQIKGGSEGAGEEDVRPDNTGLDDQDIDTISGRVSPSMVTIHLEPSRRPNPLIENKVTMNLLSFVLIN